jgi:hypothetical protein
MFSVNNQKREGKPFPSLFLFVFFAILWIVSNSNAQNLNKYYKVVIQENGKLYFIEPEIKFRNKKNYCKLFFDLTHLTTNDTVSLNFSYSNNIIREIDSIGFIQDNEKIISITKKIFIDANKTLWYHRYSSKFSFNDLNQIFQTKTSPVILLYSKGEVIDFETSKNEWKKKSELMNRIFSLIKVN